MKITNIIKEISSCGLPFQIEKLSLDKVTIILSLNQELEQDLICVAQIIQKSVWIFDLKLSKNLELPKVWISETLMKRFRYQPVPAFETTELKYILKALGWYFYNRKKVLPVRRRGNAVSVDSAFQQLCSLSVFDTLDTKPGYAENITAKSFTNFLRIKAL